MSAFPTAKDENPLIVSLLQLKKMLFLSSQTNEVIVRLVRYIIETGSITGGVLSIDLHLGYCL